MVLPPFLDFRRTVRNARDALLAQMDPSSRLYYTTTKKFEDLLNDLPDIELAQESEDVAVTIGWGDCGGISDMKVICRRLVWALQEQKRLLHQTKMSYHVLAGQVKSKNALLDYMRKTLHGEVIRLKQLLVQQQHGLLTAEDMEGLVHAQFTFLDMVKAAECIGPGLNNEKEQMEILSKERKMIEAMKIELQSMIQTYSRQMSSTIGDALDFEHRAMMEYIGHFVSHVPQVVDLYTQQVEHIKESSEKALGAMRKEIMGAREELALNQVNLQLDREEKEQLQTEVNRLTAKLKKVEALNELKKVEANVIETQRKLEEDRRVYECEVHDRLIRLHSLFHDPLLQRSTIHKCLEVTLTGLSMDFEPIPVKPDVVPTQIEVPTPPPAKPETRSYGVNVGPSDFGTPAEATPISAREQKATQTTKEEESHIVVKSVLHGALERASKEVGVDCSFILLDPALNDASQTVQRKPYEFKEAEGELHVDLEHVVLNNIRPQARLVRRVVNELCTILHREATRNTGCLWRLSTTEDGIAIFKKLVCLEEINLGISEVVYMPEVVEPYVGAISHTTKPSTCAARWARLPKKTNPLGESTTVPLTPTGRSAGSAGAGRSLLVPSFHSPNNEGEIPAWPNMPPAQRIRRSRAAGVVPEVSMRPLTPVPKNMYYGRGM